MDEIIAKTRWVDWNY